MKKFNVQKLNDNEVGAVFGGVDFGDVCAFTTLSSIPVALATSAAALGCYIRSENARKKGDSLKADQYARATKGLGIATVAVGGVGTAGLAGAFIADNVIR